MKIIILSCTLYRDKTGIISAISENEFITFSIPSLYGKTNKFAYLKEPFTVADVTLVSSQKTNKLVLIDSKPIFLPMIFSNSLDKMFSLKFMNEILLATLMDEEKIEMFSVILKAIDKISSLKYMYENLFVFLAICLKKAGFLFETSCCVNCGTKEDIIGFSFDEGGLLCRNCNNGTLNKSFFVKEIHILHEMFQLDDFKETYKNAIDKKEFLLLMAEFSKFIKDSLGLEIKSLNLIK